MNIKLKVKDKINKRHKKKHIQNEKCYEYKNGRFYFFLQELKGWKIKSKKIMTRMQGT